MGATNFNSPAPEIPKGFSEQFIIKDETSQEVLPFTKYTLTTDDGDTYEAISDKDGRTLEIFTATPQKIDMKIERNNQDPLSDTD